MAKFGGTAKFELGHFVSGENGQVRAYSWVRVFRLPWRASGCEVVVVRTMLTPLERLSNPDAVLKRTDLRELGYERGAIDAIFRACPVEVWPGYSRPLLRVSVFLEWRERQTFGVLATRVRDRRVVKIEDRVRPSREATA